MVVVTLILLLALGTIYGQSRKLRDLQQELILLRNTCQEIIRGHRPSQSFSPSSYEIQSLYRLFLAAIENISAQEERSSAYRQIMEQGYRIVSLSDESASSATEALHVVLENLYPQAIGAALVAKSSLSASIEVIATLGLPGERLNSALLMLLETKLDQTLDSADLSTIWGLERPPSCSLFDFQALGIESFITSPLMNAGQVKGMLWVGLRRGCLDTNLDQQRRLLAITQHAASSLEASWKVEEKLSKSHQERDYLLGISHDLKAPGNTALYAIASLLSHANRALTEEQELYLRTIESSLQEQQAIIADVLDMARHQRGFLAARKIALTPFTYLKETSERFALSARSRNLQFAVVVADDDNISDKQVAFDPQHLLRIVSNLLSNALKYTDTGALSLRFRTAGSELLIEVADTGIGIPANQQALLFGEYQRLSNGQNRKGVGLGLAVSKVLAKLNDATLSYSPNEPQGSIFRLTMPLLKIAPSVEPAASEKQTGGHILIIDDDDAALRSYTRYLQPLSLDISAVRSESEALAILKDNEPSLVICDLHLGDKLSTELLRTIRSRFKNIPILLVTGSCDETLLAPLVNEMGIIVLEKPICRETLLQHVEAAWCGKKAKNQNLK